MLNPDILAYLVKKTGKKSKSVRNALSGLHQRYSGLTMNQVAQIYAMQHSISVRSKLTPEEKRTFPNLDIQKPTTIVKKIPKNSRKRQVTQFIRYETTNPFIKAHVDEVNKCYTFGGYTAAFILCRKIIENMLTDIIRKKYPSEVNLYFDASRGRTRDFSEIIKNMRSKAIDFGPDKKLLERALTKADQFKDDANDKAHSWFHIVKSTRELDETHVQDIVDMLAQL
jgi:hypothetical protein